MAKLFPYQADGVEFLSGRPRGLLFDVPGLGKTAQAIRAADEVLDAGDTLVVICPASLTVNWMREIRAWRNRKWDFIVVSYDRLVRGFELPPAFAGLVLDEAHYCKSLSAKRTKAALGLVRRSRYAWALTGTPSPNGPHELYTLLRVFAPAVITGKNGKMATYLQFINRYCTTEPNPFGIYPKITGGKNGAELKALLAPYMLRRTKAQVLKDLPPLIQNNLAVSVLPGQAKTIAKLEGQLDAATIGLLMQGQMNALAGEHVATLRKITGTVKAAAIAQIVRDELDEGLSKIVLFAHHHDVLDILQTELGDFGLVRLDGKTSPKAKQDAIDAFQMKPDCRVFLGQITAAGVGITLTAAQSALFCEMSWVPAENEQAAQRIHRIGQKGSCMVRYAILPNSLDERIVDALRSKMTAINAVFS